MKYRIMRLFSPDGFISSINVEVSDVNPEDTDLAIEAVKGIEAKLHEAFPAPKSSESSSDSQETNAPQPLRTFSGQTRNDGHNEGDVFQFKGTVQEVLPRKEGRSGKLGPFKIVTDAGTLQTFDGKLAKSLGLFKGNEATVTVKKTKFGMDIVSMGG